MKINKTKLSTVEKTLILLKKYGVQAAKINDIEVSFFPVIPKLKETLLTFENPQTEEEKQAELKEKFEDDLYFSAN